MCKLAPIVLFVYNRPWHTEQTLNYLMLNELASDSILYIYADGAKPNATDEQLKDLSDVRRIIREKHWCKEVVIIESESNKGLANSIIEGVTEIVNKHGKVIVMEDDLVSSIGFLRYMNEALTLYEDNEKVAGVTGFSFVESTDNTFFFYDGSSWSWGTWKRIWDQTNFDGAYWLTKLNSRKIRKRFNLNNLYDYYQMLKDQQDGLNDSWAIRFYCSYFFNQQLFLYPQKSMILNIGFDIGTHCGGGQRSNLKEYDYLLQKVIVQKIDVSESFQNNKLILKYYRVNFGSHFSRVYRFYKVKAIKWLKKLFLTCRHY